MGDRGKGEPCSRAGKFSPTQTGGLARFAKADDARQRVGGTGEEDCAHNHTSDCGHKQKRRRSGKGVHGLTTHEFAPSSQVGAVEAALPREGIDVT